MDISLVYHSPSLDKQKTLENISFIEDLLGINSFISKSNFSFNSLGVRVYNLSFHLNVSNKLYLYNLLRNLFLLLPLKNFLLYNNSENLNKYSNFIFNFSSFDLNYNLTRDRFSLINYKFNFNLNFKVPFIYSSYFLNLLGFKIN